MCQPQLNSIQRAVRNDGLGGRVATLKPRPGVRLAVASVALLVSFGKSLLSVFPGKLRGVSRCRPIPFRALAFL